MKEIEGKFVRLINSNHVKQVREFFDNFVPKSHTSGWTSTSNRVKGTDKVFYGVRDGVVLRLSKAELKEGERMVTLADLYNIAHRANSNVRTEEQPAMREFSTGATRNIDHNKLDFEGFLSPTALEAYAQYMHKNRLQADGQLRDSDNWQKGIPMDAYMKSMYRHFFDTWKGHRGLETPEDQISNLCGLFFNVQGMLHELLKKSK